MLKKKFLLEDILESSLSVLLDGCDIVSVDKSSYGRSDDERMKHNIYGLARSEAKVKSLVEQFSNLGFYLVAHKNGISTFYRYGAKELFDALVLKSEKYKRYGEIYYSLDYPDFGVKPSRLLVVFSSVADFSYNADIERRCFFKNFTTISKYVPYDTIVVRVSDFGGVVGNFYLNSNYSNEIESDIQKLLYDLEGMTGVKKENTILYGGSKGGTGALYHGLKGGYYFVAVDPIVSDEHYEEKHNDRHFTKNTFPVTKKDKFDNLLLECEKTKGYIISSHNSPIYKYLSSMNFPKDVSLIDVRHKNIKDHSDVGVNTINLLMLLINSIFYKFEVNVESIVYHEINI